MAGASDYTAYLASLGGGAIKDGGGGMKEGVEKLIDLAVKANTQGIIAKICYIGAGLLLSGGVAFTISSHNHKKRLRHLNIYHRLIYTEKVLDIQEISKKANKSCKTVIKEVQDLIDKGFIVGAKVDICTGRVILEE